MSDSDERSMRAMRAELTLAYMSLAVACTRLPIPIELPQGKLHVMDDLAPAVRRVVDIIDDQPVDEGIQALIFSASVDWLTAADLYVLMGREGVDKHRRYCFAGGIERLRHTLHLFLREIDPDGVPEE